MSRPGERDPDTGEIIQPNQYTTVKHPATGERMLKNVRTGECIPVKDTPFQVPSIKSKSPKGKGSSNGEYLNDSPGSLRKGYK